MKCLGYPFRRKAKVKIRWRKLRHDRRHRFPERETLNASVFVYTEFVLWYATIATALPSSLIVVRRPSQHVHEIMTSASRYLDHG